MRRVKKPYLAVQGTKSSKEKFAGALFTTTVEAFVPTSGRGIQVSDHTHAALVAITWGWSGHAGRGGWRGTPRHHGTLFAEAKTHPYVAFPTRD